MAQDPCAAEHPCRKLPPCTPKSHPHAAFPDLPIRGIVNNLQSPLCKRLQKYIADNGVEAAIVKYTGVEKDSRMYNKILEEYKKLG